MKGVESSNAIAIFHVTLAEAVDGRLGGQNCASG
jgi:hypothetical protein